MLRLLLDTGDDLADHLLGDPEVTADFLLLPSTDDHLVRDC